MKICYSVDMWGVSRQPIQQANLSILTLDVTSLKISSHHLNLKSQISDLNIYEIFEPFTSFKCSGEREIEWS